MRRIQGRIMPRALTVLSLPTFEERKYYEDEEGESKLILEEIV